MRELRVQSEGELLRVFHAFDPPGFAGGNKAGDGQFYQRLVPLAERLYHTYLDEIRKEGLIP